MIDRLHDHRAGGIPVGRDGAPQSASVRRARRSTTSAAPHVGVAGGEVPAAVSEAIVRTSGHGEPLGEPIRAGMERAFGVGLDAVRIHRDSTLTAPLGAQAFTVGRDVHIAPGRYAPTRADGQRLLAHELAHVVQQGAAPTRIRRSTAPPAGDADEPGPVRVERRVMAEPRVQRLVGFEVELSVPVVGPAALAPQPRVGGPAPHHQIAMFFGGGPIYATNMGTLTAMPAGDQITLKTDHNPLQRAGRQLYNAISLIPSGGAVPLLPAGGYVQIANLEYETPPLDELAAGSNARYQALATRIDQHAQAIMNMQPANVMSVIPSTGMGYFAGTPVAHLNAWLGPWLGPAGPAALANLVTNFRNLVAWQMNIQATVGMVPTGLRALFTARAGAMPGAVAGTLDAAKQDASNAIVNGVAALSLQGWFTGLVGGLAAVDQEAFQGALHLGLSYAIGNALNQAALLRPSTVNKSAVPLLNKLAPVGLATDLGLLTSVCTTPFLQANPPNAPFITQIANWLHANVPQTNAAYWQAPPYPPGPGAGPHRGPTYGAGLAPATATDQMLTRLLTGVGGLVAGPGPGTPLVNPDPVNVGGGPLFGQQGIPLEYRWFATQPNAAGQLWPAFQTVLNEVRTANLTGVPGAVTGPILGAL